MLNSLLLYRLVLLNASLAAGCVWAYWRGYVEWLFSFETTGIGYGLVALTVLAILGCFHRAYKVSSAFDSIKAGRWVDTSKLLVKSGYIGQIATVLMLVGLWANSLGIFLSFTAIDFSSVDTILTSVSGMYDGLRIAFVNSLISIALYVAVRVNLHVLTTATRLLMIDADDLKARA